MKAHQKQLISALLVRIDQLVSQQLACIYQVKVLQDLEARWRCLHFLVSSFKDDPDKVKIRFLSLTRAEFERQVLAGINSSLFSKIYSFEYDMAGGEPFSVLIGDYAFSHHSKDLALLEEMAQMAAASFCPFIAKAAPSLFGCDYYEELHPGLDIARIFSSPDYERWHQLRQLENMRFVGLCFPNVLVSDCLPNQNQGFIFQGKRLLWGNAAFFYVHCLATTFVTSAWFGLNDPALVQTPAQPGFLSGTMRIENNITQVTLTQSFADFGLLGIERAFPSGQAIFPEHASLHAVARINDNAIFLSSRLNYLLCACRFAHAIKQISRNLIGSFLSLKDVEQRLNEWLLDFVATNDSLSDNERVGYPLKFARVEIRPKPAGFNAYLLTLRIRPHYRLAPLPVDIVLKTIVNKG